MDHDPGNADLDRHADTPDTYGDATSWDEGIPADVGAEVIAVGRCARLELKHGFPHAGRHSFEAAEFIALLVAQNPDKGQVLQRCYSYYTNRTRGERRKAQGVALTTAGAAAGRAVGGWMGQCSHGLNRLSPVDLKSATLRVTSTI